MKSGKLRKWQENLKPGIPIRVLYNHTEVYGVFIGWKNYGYGDFQGCQYISIPIWQDDAGKLKWLEARHGPYLDRIISNADHRVRPVDMKWVSKADKTCFETLKNRIYEYKNN